MTKATAVSQVKSGFRTAGALLLGIAWLFVVFAGMIIAFPPPGKYPPAVGWVLLVIAALVLIATMDHWVKVLPGILAYGIFGGVLTLVDGHALNHPEVPVTRFDAVFMLLIIGASAWASFAFAKRKLKLLDRLALFSFICCIFWQIVIPRMMRLSLSLGFCFLLFAWLYDRFQHRWDLR